MFRSGKETRVIVMTPKDQDLYGVIIPSQSQPVTVVDPVDCFDIMQDDQAAELDFVGDEADLCLKHQAGIAGFEFKAAIFIKNVITRWQ